MASTYITYKCGHSDNVQIYGTNVHGERDRKAAWYGTIDCPDCKKAEAAQWCADNGCATLAGSDKQVAWAEAIRREAIAGLEIAADMIPADAPEAVRRQASEVIDGAKAETRASWWIDNRDSGNVRGAIDYYRDAQR